MNSKASLLYKNGRYIRQSFYGYTVRNSFEIDGIMKDYDITCIKIPFAEADEKALRKILPLCDFKTDAFYDSLLEHIGSGLEALARIAGSGRGKASHFFSPYRYIDTDESSDGTRRVYIVTDAIDPLYERINGSDVYIRLSVMLDMFTGILESMPVMHENGCFYCVFSASMFGMLPNAGDDDYRHVRLFTMPYGKTWNDSGPFLPLIPEERAAEWEHTDSSRDYRAFLEFGRISLKSLDRESISPGLHESLTSVFSEDTDTGPDEALKKLKEIRKEISEGKQEDISIVTDRYYVSGFPLFEKSSRTEDEDLTGKEEETEERKAEGSGNAGKEDKEQRMSGVKKLLAVLAAAVLFICFAAAAYAVHGYMTDRTPESSYDLSDSELSSDEENGKEQSSAQESEDTEAAKADNVRADNALHATINISDASVYAEDQVYYGGTLYPDVTVTLVPAAKTRGAEYVLHRDKDYTVEMSDNVEVGVAHIVVTGKGNYSGQASGTFNIIVPPEQEKENEEDAKADTGQKAEEPDPPASSDSSERASSSGRSGSSDSSSSERPSKKPERSSSSASSGASGSSGRSGGSGSYRKPVRSGPSSGRSSGNSGSSRRSGRSSSSGSSGTGNRNKGSSGSESTNRDPSGYPLYPGSGNETW